MMYYDDGKTKTNTDVHRALLYTLKCYFHGVNISSVSVQEKAECSKSKHKSGLSIYIFKELIY